MIGFCQYPITKCLYHLILSFFVHLCQLLFPVSFWKELGGHGGVQYPYEADGFLSFVTHVIGIADKDIGGCICTCLFIFTDEQ